MFRSFSPFLAKLGFSNVTEMEHSEPVSIPQPEHEQPSLESKVQSSTPKSDLDPPSCDLDYTAGIEEELRILDLREAEERDSIQEEKVEIEEEEEEEEAEVKDEDSESDENNRSTNIQNETQPESENENENENGNQMRKRYPYPVRPEAEDCAFYMKTGTCKFGSNCKFNHPVRRKKQAAKEKVNEREELIGRQDQSQSQNLSQIECKYYLRTGGCKFGKACRYNHIRAKSTASPVIEFNFLGLPIRQGEKECPYYMRTGSCKYGANCRFNHPDPTAVGVPDSPSGYGNGGSLSSQASIGSWSSPRGLRESAPFASMMCSPTQGVSSQNSEWNGYQAPLYPPERSVHSLPTYVMNNPVMDNVYTNRKPQVLVDEFPERPGQPECSYFLRTGDCKYKANCKYHHPKNRISNSPLPCTLSDKGLPLRPDQNICSHYSRYGICKFGPACKYDHPLDPPASSGEYGLDLPPPFSNSAASQESGMVGNGNGDDSF